MKLAIFCSTPNFRGIHQYSLYLSRLSREIFANSYLRPNSSAWKFNKTLRFVSQIIWELFPGIAKDQADVEIYASPRLPLRAFFGDQIRPLRGLVLLDFIQFVDLSSPKNIIDVCLIFGLHEFVKRIVHTAYCNISLRRANFVIIISSFTNSTFSERLPRQATRLAERSLILHPAPSFTRNSVLQALQSIPLRSYSHPVTVHVVTGSLPSKHPALLQACLACLKAKAAQQEIKLIVNVFGYSSFALSVLNSSNFNVNCNPKSVPESDLIQSYLLSDLFLSTSSQEGFGIPLLDSILFDLCCITTPIDPFREIAKAYRPLSNTVYFSSSYDISVADQMASLIMKASRSFVFRSPKQKAQAYIEASETMFASAQERLAGFLEHQFLTCS